MTAAELRAIGERVAQEKPDGWKDAMQAYRDRVLLYETLERLIERMLYRESDSAWWIPRSPELFSTKDAAIDALLKQGGGE